MTLSWKELTCYGLLKKLGDPSLTKEILKVIMAGHRDYLDEEAREYHTWYVIPVVNVYQGCTWSWDNSPSCFRARSCAASERVVGYDEAWWGLRNRAPELWKTAIRYKNLKKELICSWKERRPYSRRDFIYNALWDGSGEGEMSTDISPGYAQLSDLTNAKCQWFQGIHEGRYYLFWHKDSFREATKYTHYSVVASIDINVIEGRTFENPWGSQQYPDICWDPKYLRENPKERKHIDDMF